MKKRTKGWILPVSICISSVSVIMVIMAVFSSFGNINKNDKINNTEIVKTEQVQEQEQKTAGDEENITKTGNSKIIVLDPGHGVSSFSMSDSQKEADGWIYNSSKGGWGEWRHWKSGTFGEDCNGSGCTGRAPANGGCWYPMVNGDRATEPEINLNNALAAKKYLEQMGYTVRMARGESDNPSMTKRLEYCYPNQDMTKEPDADAYICLHSNAGGGKGSCYISLSGLYDQAGIAPDYIEQGNALGKAINDRIVSDTSLSAAGGGRYDGYPTLVLFCKSQITIAYMEIGFFDNAADLSILRNESDAIGKAIANGINDYYNS